MGLRMTEEDLCLKPRFRMPKMVQLPETKLRATLMGRINNDSVHLINDIVDCIIDHHHYVDCYDALTKLKVVVDKEFVDADDKHSEIMFEHSKED
jgi:hypothetical protein